jgi:hypothetical protein
MGVMSATKLRDAVSMANYPRRGGQFGGYFANTLAAAAAARGRLTADSGNVGSGPVRSAVL